MNETVSTDMTQQNPAAAQPQNGTVVVDGLGYAVGLVWQPLQNPDDPIPEVRETMESDEELDLYCLRFSSSPQYGLGKKAMGHKAGEPALAASVAAALSDQSSVCAVFRVKEGWWFVVIRNDLILSEEDILFTNEADAQKAFFSMMAVPDWDKKIAPAEWNVEGAEVGNLAELIKGTRKVRLDELSAVKRTQILVFIAVIVLGFIGLLIYGLVSLWDNFTRPTDKLLEVPKPEVIKPVEPVPEQAKPWEKIVDAAAFAHRCWNNAYQLQVITIPGWTLGRITCTPAGLTTSWTPNAPSSRLIYVKNAMNEYKLTKLNIQLDSSGKSATGSVSWNDLPVLASLPNMTPDALQEDLTDIVQATGLPFNFSREQIVVPPNNPDGSVPPNQQTYTAFKFTTSSMYSPFEWVEFLDKFSGSELTKIEYDPNISEQSPSTNKWTYEGRIYAK